MTRHGLPSRGAGLRRVFVALPLLLLLVAANNRPRADCGAIPAAADKASMRLTVEHRRDMDILHIEGRLAADLPRRMEALFAKNRRIGEIWLNSSGGDLQAAIDTGRFVRANEIYLTRVPDGAACIEVCGILFLSGRIRAVDPHGIFGVGYLPSGEEREGEAGLADSATTAALQTDAISDYLIRMGVSRRLLSEVIIRDSAGAGRRCMTQQEIASYNVANSYR